jgi:predicted lipoprotein with Yx(FWY)xxD motif
MKKMKKLFSKGFVLPFLILLITMNSCKKDTTATPHTLKYDINLSTNDSLGQYLTNKDGLTLYVFANDADGVNTCTGGCEAVWPVFTTDLATAKLDPGLMSTDFATITNPNGMEQVTYKGWPLYTYSPHGTGNYGNSPENPSSVGGEGIGGIWFVAKPDYTIMLANKQLTGLDGNKYKSDYTIGTGQTTYFTDSAGRTLYTFIVDSFNINKFTKPDLSNNNVFPIYEQQKIVVPSILDKTLFGTITVAGKEQMTYKGWPLYYFGQDLERGSNKSVSVPVPGKWPVAVKNVAEAPKK